MGALNEFSLWPWMMGREPLAVSAEEIIEETIRMFVRHYRRSAGAGHNHDAANSKAGDLLEP